MTETKFVLRVTHISRFKGYEPYAGEPLYLYKSVSRNRRGWLADMVTPRLDDARQWATRKGAEGYLANKLTFEPDENGVVSKYVVEEVAR